MPRVAVAARDAGRRGRVEPLEFFNGTGGFAEDGREYVTVLQDGASTPAPWLNVIANPGFGFQVSAEGSGHTWAENSRENQLTPWSNDPVSDPPGEAVYLRDLDSGALWTPTALPIRGPGRYTARHGFGYSRFEHEAQGIAAEMLQFVPMDDPVKITRLTLTNRTQRRTPAVGHRLCRMGPGHVAQRHRRSIWSPRCEGGALFARNPLGDRLSGSRRLLLDLGPDPDGWTADRAAFLGTGGSMAAPRGAEPGALGTHRRGARPLRGAATHPNPRPGETAEVVILLGQAADADAARALIARMRAADPEALRAEVSAHWTALLSAVQVETPDRAMDILLNGWLLYQTLACRIWARAGFYQASGAYGFRDQLQDGMALTFARPEMTRAHLLRAAARQFPEGDVQHWWLPHSGQGVRTRISDDRVWLGYGVARYVAVSGDAGILDEEVPVPRRA